MDQSGRAGWCLSEGWPGVCQANGREELGLHSRAGTEEMESEWAASSFSHHDLAVVHSAFYANLWKLWSEGSAFVLAAVELDLQILGARGSVYPCPKQSEILKQVSLSHRTIAWDKGCPGMAHFCLWPCGTSLLEFFLLDFCLMSLWNSYFQVSTHSKLWKNLNSEDCDSNKLMSLYLALWITEDIVKCQSLASQGSEPGTWDRAQLEYRGLGCLFTLAGENISANQILLLRLGTCFVQHTIIMNVIFWSKVGMEMLGNTENRKNQTGTYEACE